MSKRTGRAEIGYDVTDAMARLVTVLDGHDLDGEITVRITMSDGGVVTLTGNSALNLRRKLS